MKSKGFTLVELLVVIGILGLLIGVSTYSILSIMNRNTDETMEMMENNLKDAAVTYGVSKIFLKKCTPGFQISDSSLSDPTDPSNSCFKTVKVSYLEENGYFKDDGERCDKQADVYIYNYVEEEGGAGEYRAYVKRGTCN